MVIPKIYVTHSATRKANVDFVKCSLSPQTGFAKGGQRTKELVCGASPTNNLNLKLCFLTKCSCLGIYQFFIII